MKFFKNDHGITMTTLVVTIIILLIVSSTMIYSGVSTYQSMMKQNFLAEMQLIQAEVNKFADAYIQKADSLGISVQSFKNAYYSIYDVTNNGAFINYEMETQQKYIEFHEFVNSYNSIETNYQDKMLEISGVTVKNSNGAGTTATDMFFIPPAESTKAQENGINEGHADELGMGTLQDVLNVVWHHVIDSDGSQFVPVPEGKTLDEAILIDQKNYFYFTREMASQFFNMEISTDLVIDFDDRYVISVSKNVEENDKFYHSEYYLQGGEKSVDYSPNLPNEKKVKLDFTSEVEYESENKRYKITIKPKEDNTMAIKSMYYYAGYSTSHHTGSKYETPNGFYKLSPNKTWNLIDGTSFYTSESDTFGIKIVDMNNNEAYGIIKVVYTNIPEVAGLIPIVFDEENSNWKVAEEGDVWCDYENGIWGNAMMDDIAIYNESTGELTQPGSMFVWIPRFAYRVVYFSSVENKLEYITNGDATKISAYCNSNGFTRVNGSELSYNEFLAERGPDSPYIVEVKFLMGNTNNDDSGVDVTTPYGGNYRVHPAFTNEVTGKEISGFWISKFNITEASLSYNGATPKKTAISTYEGCKLPADVSMTTVGGIQNQNVFYSMFLSAYTIKYNMKMRNENIDITNVNSHMIKNIEYGAMVLLTAATMEGKSVGTQPTNTNNAYGIFGLLSSQKIYTAAVTQDYKNTVRSEIDRNLPAFKNAAGWEGETDRETLQNKTDAFLDIYQKMGDGKPEEFYGDSICELSYTPNGSNTIRYGMRFLDLGIVLANEKPADFVITRGSGYGLSSGAEENIVGVYYDTSITTKAYTRAVLMVD